MKRLKPILGIALSLISVAVLNTASMAEERKILFLKAESQFNVINSDESNINVDIEHKFSNICNNIYGSLEELGKANTQDKRILYALEITNYMNKDTGLDFGEKIVNIFNVNTNWSVELNAARVNNDNTADMLIVMKSDSTVYKPIAVNFHVNEYSVIETTFY